jgi:hypothetical protein
MPLGMLREERRQIPRIHATTVTTPKRVRSGQPASGAELDDQRGAAEARQVM